MVLSNFDRQLLEQCLQRAPKAWEDFVDRFLGLVAHVVNHSCSSRSIPLDSSLKDDLIAEVFLGLVKDDFAVLRRFRGRSSLATYLTVVSRRIVVRSLVQRRLSASATHSVEAHHLADPASNRPPEAVMADQEELNHLIEGLNESEAEVIRLFHLEGRTYEEISSRTGVPANSIGPMLSRARDKMRQAGRVSAE